MQNTLTSTISLLERTPAALDALLRNLPEMWTAHNEGQTASGENTWTVSDVISHLIDCERTNWMPRARHILELGASAPFPPFDRLESIRRNHGTPLSERLDEFARMRAASLAELRAFDLQTIQLEMPGLHPVFGEITLSQLLSTWAAHDLTHLHQISRIMAYQYREAIGPWAKYLGVLHCNGHSS